MELSHYWPSLLTVFGASFLAFLSPGPNFVAIASAAVASRTNGLAVALGCSLGTTFWALMAVSGISAVLALHPKAGLVMQLVGGGYLMYIGFKSLRLARRSAGSMAPARMSAKLSLSQGVRRGLLIQLTNPKSALFWLSMVSVVLSTNTPVVVGVLLVVGTTLIALAWHSVLAVAFSHQLVITSYLRFGRQIGLVFGLVFLGLGGKLVLLALSGPR